MPSRTTARSPKLAILPLTPDRWPDLETLFGPRGASGGCWCMWWRISRSEWKTAKGEGNRRALEGYVRRGRIPGLLAYDGDAPVGWVAVEPREAYPSLERSKRFARVDEKPVWSVTCFFVAPSHRGRGVTRALIQAALAHARAAGARLVEAYPVDSRRPLADPSVYTGAASTFRKLGFREAARRSPTRPIVRKALRPLTPTLSPAARGRGGPSTPR